MELVYFILVGPYSLSIINDLQLEHKYTSAKKQSKGKINKICIVV